MDRTVWREKKKEDEGLDSERLYKWHTHSLMTEIFPLPLVGHTGDQAFITWTSGNTQDRKYNILILYSLSSHYHLICLPPHFLSMLSKCQCISGWIWIMFPYACIKGMRQWLRWRQVGLRFLSRGLYDCENICTKCFLISPFISLYPVHLCFLPLSINLSFLHYGGVYPYLSGFFLGLRWGTTLWQRSSDDSSTNPIVAESHREDGTDTKSSILRCACGQFPPSRLQHLTPQPVNSAISS